MKKTLTLSLLLFFITGIAQAQNKIVGEKGSAVVGEKGSVGIIGEKGTRDEAIAKTDAQVEAAFADYNRQREEMEKSLANLRLKIEESIKLSEKYKRFRSPKQGFVLRNRWKAALTQWEEAKKKINAVNAGVVAPDMIQP